MKSTGIFKAGKGMYGKGKTEVKPEDIFLIDVPSKTAELENNGDNGTNKYLTTSDLFPSGSGIISGGSVVWVEGFTFDVPEYVYLVDGVVYTADPDRVVTDGSDPILNREDLIIGTYDVEGNGVYQIIKGTSAPIAIAPSIDPKTQIKIASIIVDAGSTEPIIVEEPFVPLEVKTKLSEFINDGNGDITKPFITVDEIPATDGSKWQDKAGGIQTIKFGYLYNFYTVTDVRNIANTGWRVPLCPTPFTNTGDFYTLFNYLSPSPLSKILDPSLEYWDDFNSSTNSSGLSLRGSGKRSILEGIFSGLKAQNNLWTTQEDSPTEGIIAEISAYNIDYPSSGGYTTVSKNNGSSIRLVKESTTLTNGQTGTYTGNDGKVYKTICIGTQEWLAEDLAETQYRDLSLIPEVTDYTTWAGLSTGARCSYDNLESNALSTTIIIEPKLSKKISVVDIYDYEAPTAGISEAPIDGFNYARKDASWVSLSGLFVDLTTAQTVAGAKTWSNIATFSVDANINSRTIGKGSGNINSNTVFGYQALFNNTTGFNNVAMGWQVLSLNTTGSNNVGIGIQSLYYNTTGSANIGIGSGALGTNVTSGQNVAIGDLSLTANTGNQNTAVGADTLRFNNIGANNTTIGFHSLYANSSGNYNTAVGNSALQSNTTGWANLAIGASSLKNNTIGSYNIAIGLNSGEYAINSMTNRTQGDNSIYIGRDSMAGQTIADNEIVIGYSAVGKGSNTAVLGNTSLTQVFSSGVFVSDGDQKEITAATYTVLATDNRKTIFFNSATAVTVTVNNDLPSKFMCDFYNLGVGTVTFVAGTATLGMPDGTMLETDKVCALLKVLNLNNYKLKGELV